MLWKINFSNRLYVLTPKTIISPYKAYVGGGNNSRLIKGIVKRRYWWVLVEKSYSNEANLLWTQLKVNDFFQKQNKGVKLSYKSNVEIS